MMSQLREIAVADQDFELASYVRDLEEEVKRRLPAGTEPDSATMLRELVGKVQRSDEKGAVSFILNSDVDDIKVSHPDFEDDEEEAGLKYIESARLLARAVNHLGIVIDRQKEQALTCCFCGATHDSLPGLKAHSGVCVKHPLYMPDQPAGACNNLTLKDVNQAITGAIEDISHRGLLRNTPITALDGIFTALRALQTKFGTGASPIPSVDMLDADHKTYNNVRIPLGGGMGVLCRMVSMTSRNPNDPICKTDLLFTDVTGPKAAVDQFIAWMSDPQGLTDLVMDGGCESIPVMHGVQLMQCGSSVVTDGMAIVSNMAASSITPLN